MIYHIAAQKQRYRRRAVLLQKGESMICPMCGTEHERLLALSRKDNKTMICDECGTKEALDAAGLIEGSSMRVAIIGASSKWRKQYEQC